MRWKKMLKELVRNVLVFPTTEIVFSKSTGRFGFPAEV